MDAKHYHQALYDESGKLTEDCALCGENFRNTEVHIVWEKIIARSQTNTQDE